ncbi:MAG: hypothetical protein SVY10_19870, partial [Thermodesulfobacteriota bacterium]|nr:hypothetical protein [Thermodesulfobacteriota bacterium]
FLTNRRSYSLIYKGNRIFGFDNYRFWHYHPVEEPNTHVSCKEPSASFTIQEIRKAIEIKKRNHTITDF